MSEMMGPPGAMPPSPGAGPGGASLTPESANLRAAANPQQSCQTCPNWQQGMCAVLGIQTQPNMVCDAYGAQPAHPGEPGAVPGGGPDVMSQLFGGAPGG